MLGKIIVGIIIGFVCGIFFSKNNNSENKYSGIVRIFLMLIAVSFMTASFGAGVMFGVMAAGEIALGYYLYSRFGARALEKTKEE